MFKLSKKEDVDVHPEKGKLIETYWSEYAGATYDVNIERENPTTGKMEPVPKTHPVTGFPLMSGNNYLYMEESIVFTNYKRSGKTPFDKSWCFYKVYEKTPNNIKNELKKLHKQNEVCTNDEWMKECNPEAFKNFKENRSIKEDNKAKDVEIAKLKAKLTEIENSNKSQEVKKKGT